MSTISYGGAQAPVIFTDKIDKGLRLPYFYLHNKAEDFNGYDCCQGNLDTFYYALQDGYFLCDIVNNDQSVTRGICFVQYEIGRMLGWICYLDDLEGIREALVQYSKATNSYSHFEEELQADYITVWNMIKSKK